MSPELIGQFSGSNQVGVVKTAPLQFPELRLNFEHDPFDQPHFRRALSRALDRNQLLKTVFLGQGRAADKGYPHPDAPLANRSLSTPHAPDEARGLLDGLGFLDRDGDGVCGLLPAAALVEGGRVLVCGHDLAELHRASCARCAGIGVALIPQEAMSALNPLLRVGHQDAEALTVHRPVPAAEARSRVTELLALVGLDPGRARDYPHELSGGMRHRVVIAIALANDPAVVIADEPTSGLDVLLQADVLDLLDELRQRLGIALLVVSHSGIPSTPTPATCWRPLRGCACRKPRRVGHHPAAGHRRTHRQLPSAWCRAAPDRLRGHQLPDRRGMRRSGSSAVERYLPRYPHQLSGGERQRVAFARAVVTPPRLILANEPTQMHDASLRAGMADLLDELRAARGVAVLHITHDLALAQRSCDRLVVLHAGRIVEQGPTDDVLSRPVHPYTVALLDAACRLHGAAPSTSRRDDRGRSGVVSLRCPGQGFSDCPVFPGRRAQP